jgi:hypothetical protein
VLTKYIPPFDGERLLEISMRRRHTTYSHRAVTERLKVFIRNQLAVLGLDIVRVRTTGTDSRISGTFPPHGGYSSVGSPRNFFIHDGYAHRRETTYFDDTANADRWQREVYRFAREIFDEHRLETVCDIGCGSGHKLVKYFGDRNGIGFDVAETCNWLRNKYPKLKWLVLDLKAVPPIRVDLVIAADIVEHLLEPDELLSYIAALGPKYVVLSTPDRNLLRMGTHDGPPRNTAHIREWSFAEFEAYIASRFQIVEHFISNSAQATQCILCTLRS